MTSPPRTTAFEAAEAARQRGLGVAKAPLRAAAVSRELSQALRRRNDSAAPLSTPALESSRSRGKRYAGCARWLLHGAWSVLAGRLSLQRRCCCREVRAMQSRVKCVSLRHWRSRSSNRCRYEGMCDHSVFSEQCGCHSVRDASIS
eukprot:3545220-Prymnesium_polylepis.1